MPLQGSTRSTRSRSTRKRRVIVESFGSNSSTEPQASEDDEFEAEAIMGAWYGIYGKGRGGARQGWMYLVKWKGYDEETAEWLGEENLGNLSTLIRSFKRAYPRQARKDFYTTAKNTDGFTISLKDALIAAADRNSSGISSC